MSGRALFPDSPWISHGLALLAGAMLPFSLAPFNFWWSGFVGILLLLSVIQSAALKPALIRWFLFGLGQYLVGASWIYVSISTHGGASWLLAGTLVFLFASANAGVVLAQGFVFQKYFSNSLVLAFPALWFLKEWSTTWFLSGFPWALVGYGHVGTPLAGFPPLVGVLGSGAVMVLMASLFFCAIRSAGRVRLWFAVSSVAPIVLGLLLTMVNYGRPAGDVLSVSLVQGNIDQQTKWQRSSVQPIIDRYSNLSESEWGRDLILWPEAAITLFRDSAEPLLENFQHRGKQSGTALVLGIPTRDSVSFFNSAVAVGDAEGSYIKRHLVPFGEFVPFEEVLRGAITFLDLPMSHNRAGESEQGPLQVRGTALGLSICYEIAFPNLVRGQAAQSTVLATISNDTWFGRSIGPHQHMQMAQMRALENSRYLLRGTNNGITAIVNPRGQIVERLQQFEEGVLRGSVTPMDGITPYTALGDWPLLVVLGSLLLWRLRRTDSDIGAVPQSDA